MESAAERPKRGRSRKTSDSCDPAKAAIPDPKSAFARMMRGKDPEPKEPLPKRPKRGGSNVPSDSTEASKAGAVPERVEEDTDAASMEELQTSLRDVLLKLKREQKFFMFRTPVDTEECDDYLDLIEAPMDLETMGRKLEKSEYTRCGHYNSIVFLSPSFS